MKSKIILTSLICLFFTGIIQAQVTIGIDSNPDNSSLLDIKNKGDNTSDRGLLMPRFAVNDTTIFGLSGNTLTAGMTVYNTATTAKNNGPGFYYWTGTVWRKAISIGDPADNLGNHTAIKALLMSGFPIYNASLVGVGTATPASTLHVVGDMTLTGPLKVGGNATTAGVPGNSGQVLVSSGTGSAPTWQDLATVKGTVSLQFFKQSTGRTTAPVNGYAVPSPYLDIPGLSNFTYTAPANGDLILQIVTYSAISSGTAYQADATNTQFQFTAYQGATNVATAYGMSTPMGAQTAGQNAECTTITVKVSVVKNTTYTFYLKVRDVWKSSGIYDGAYAGTYDWNGYLTPSSMMATLIAN